MLNARNIILGFLAAVVSSVDAQGVPDLRHEFQQFIKAHDKKYKDNQEKEERFRTFVTNYLHILKENAKGHSYQLGLNKFADLTPQQVAEMRTGLLVKKPQWGGLPRLGAHAPSNRSLPSSVDWRAKGAVGPVKNQQQCGSCWAFSSVGALEGAWQIATGKLLSLSEQQLVDCSSSYGNAGCSGGEMTAAFQYAEQAGLCTEESYPYAAQDGICAATNCSAAIPKGSIVGYRDVPEGDTLALMDAVAQQPVSVAIEADQMSFQLYTSGVLSADCGTRLDHGVLAVGYGATETGLRYWIVKNSWGPSWGMDGYVLIERGRDGDGQCGIKAQPTYPVVHNAAAVDAAQQQVVI